MSTRRLPAEWERQSGVVLIWPHAHSDWKHHLANIEKTYASIVAAISSRETIIIICFDDAHRTHIKQQLNSDQSNLQFITAPSNDCWVRDTAPLCVIENNDEHNTNKNYFNLLDFTFNGWGEKYPSALDNAITTHLKQAGIFGQYSTLNHPMVLEGGSIESDGQGTLLTTDRCLNNPNRNPNLTTNDIEVVLQTQLGAKRTLWLQHGHIIGDDTDGHIDTLARFCSPDTIAFSACYDETDENYTSLAAMAEELATLLTTNGKPYQLKPLPIPAAIHNSQGERLPANYANFLIINDAVLVPTYNDPNDTIALQTLGACFPEREIISIDCRTLLLQLGSLHCAAMQFPFGVLHEALA